MPQPKADEWEDVESNWEDEEESSVFSTSKPKSSISSVWDWANTPLTTAPSTFAKSVANQVDQPTLEEPWRIPFTGGATWKGLGAGMLEGAGDVASSLTSPLNAATGLATGGSSVLAKRGLTTAARGLGLAGKTLSAPVAAHGGMTILDPETSMSEKGFGLAELAGGIAGMKQKIPSAKKPGISKVGSSLIDETPINIPETIKSEPIVKPDLPETVVIKKPTSGYIKKLKEQGYEPAGTSPEGYPMMKLANELDELTTKLEGDISPEIMSSVEWIDDTAPDMSPNASGESAASLEALSRNEGMKARGESFVVYDRAGNKRPLIGPEAVDYVAKSGETYGIEGPNGFRTLDNQGGKVTAKYAKPASDIKVDPLAENPKPDGQIPEPIPASEVKKLVPQEEIPTRVRNINKEANLLKMAPKGEKEPLIRKALDFQRTLLTAYDMSAPGRQGRPLMHTKAWWTSLDDMFKSWGSDRAFKVVQDSIIDHPSGYFKSVIDSETGTSSPSFAQKAGLELTDLVTRNEEIFRSKWAERLPGVKASNRAFVGFLNKLRSDTFANMVDLAKKQGKDPETNLVLAKQISEFVNMSTGRGSLGRLEPSAKVLSDVFFAPRLMASKVQRYGQVLNPKFYTELDPMVRKEALKSLFATAGTGLLMGETARMMGAQVNNDPTSSDFRKIRFGDTRLDTFGGDQQYAVAATRLLSGQSTSSVSGKTTDLTSGKFGQQTRASVASRFFTNKLAPVPSFIWAWMEGTEFDGTPFDAKQALLSRTVPIVMQDLMELAEEDPALLPLIIPAAGGMGVQSYGR